MATQGQAHIKVTADVNEAKVRLQQMQNQLKNTGKTANDVSSSIQGAFQKIGSAMAVGLSVAGLQQFTNQLIRTRGEFQQLEIAFSTMLGSTEKADMLMKQLTQTAAKTPFDMQGIANGAKQLLAYGTAAEEVNDTIIKLGDIAAGLSLPLGDLVYLYGTTMTQGRMFTMDLRQMQGRGIPIADEIAKIMNVSKDAVPEMVTAGKVTSEIFSQAIKNMSSEGGKFYNLMEKQSASLTGQISNLEDAIAQMFNEIGKSSQDFLSSGISSISYVVEHYKEFASVLSGVIASVGLYKASIIALHSVNQAKMFADNIRLVAMFRKELGLLKAAQQAFNITAMANPYILLGSVIAGVVATIIGFTLANNGATSSQKKINEAIDEANQKYAELENKSKSLLNTIRDENSSNQSKIDAYNELSKIVPDLTEKYSLEELQIIALTTANKELLGVLEQVNIQEKKNRLSQLLTAKAQFNAQGVNENLLPVEYRDDFNMWQSNETQMSILNGLIDAETKGIRELERANLSLDEKLVASQKDLIDAQNKTLDAKKMLDRANAEKITGQTSQKQEVDILNRRSKAQEAYNNAVEREKELQEEVNDLLTQKNNDVYQNLTDEQKKALDNIKESEKKLADLKRGVTPSKNYKGDIETETKNLQELIKTYETLTGKKYQTTILSPEQNEKNLEELKKLRQKFLDENSSYEARLIQDKYALIEKEKQKQLESLKREQELYNKQYGASDESNTLFANRRKVIEDIAKLEVEQLDKEFKQWKDDFERSNNQIKFDLDVAILQSQLEITNNINEKLDIQKQLRDKLIQKQKEEIELEKRKDILEKFGEAELNAYLSGTSTNAQVKSLAQSYDQRSQLTTSSMMWSNNAEQLTANLDRFEKYANGIIDIETDLSEKRKAIERGETRGDVSTFIDWANIKKGNLLEQLGISDVPKELDNIVKLTMATSIEGLQNQMSIVTTELDALKSDGEKELELAQQKGDLEGIANAQNKIATATRLSNIALSVFNKQGDKVASLTPKWDKFSRSAQEASIIISGVANVISEVEDAFGDLLSEGAKDAIEVMKTISGVAIGLCNNQLLVAMAAGESISAVEKASVILAIISAAVQVISAITNAIMKNFSAKALFEQRMAEYEERIERLLDLQEDIDRSYQDKTGTDYWDELSNSARNYAEEQLNIEYLQRKLIAAQEKYNRLLSNYGSGFVSEAKLKNAEEEIEEITDLIENNGIDSALRQSELAMKKAEAEYNRIRSSKGEDSKSAQEAYDDWKEAEQAYNDILDTQRERIQEVVEQMATTSVTSLGETMASALVDAFSNGLSGMQKAWDETINDLIKSMLEQRLALQLMDQFEDAFKYLEEATKVETKRYLKTTGRGGLGNGGSLEYITEVIGEATLTDEEIAIFIEKMNSAKDGVMSLGEAYQQAMAELGLLDDSIDAESKGFQTMSQDTADELSGRFTALQISGAGIQMSAEGIATRVEDIVRINAGIQISADAILANSDIALQIAQGQLEQLKVIAEHTSMLNETNSRLKNIQENTSRL